MRALSDAERECLEQSTRNMLDFYTDDKFGENASYAGIAEHRGQMCDVITYTRLGKTKPFVISLAKGKTHCNCGRFRAADQEVVEEGVRRERYSLPAGTLYFQDKQPLHRMEVEKVLVNSVLEENFDVLKRKCVPVLHAGQ